MPLLTAEAILTGDRTLRPGWLRWDGEQVTAVGAGAPPASVANATGSAEPPVDLGAVTVVPGFVDSHVHGGGGASFTAGDPEQAAQAVRAHRRHGTTTTVASLVTGAPDALERGIAGLAGLVQSGELAGLHLEGPFLSPARRGAHDPTLLIDPEPAVLDRLLRAGEGTVVMVTLAPERPHGLDAVRRVVGHGAVAALGHTDADAEQIRAAVDAGARVATHLFNAMPPLGHRDPGPVGTLLADERVVVELIADGVHLHGDVVALAARAAGPGRVSLVTDAMAAAAHQDGDYRLGDLTVEVRDGVARLPGGGSIAGSTLTMDAALRFAVRRGLSLHDAVQAASVTPARVLGQSQVGRLEAGLRADLVVLDADLGVDRVMRAGAWLPD